VRMVFDKLRMQNALAVPLPLWAAAVDR
jgi:hypothetical protein